MNVLIVLLQDIWKYVSIICMPILSCLTCLSLVRNDLIKMFKQTYAIFYSSKASSYMAIYKTRPWNIIPIIYFAFTPLRLS